MDSTVKNILCPLCLESDKKFIRDYPGSFLKCKELYQCISCNLIYAVKIPNLKELDNYYSNGLYYDLDSNPFNEDIIEFSYNLALTRINLIQKKTNILIDKCKTLDIGAGNGSFGSALKAKFNQAVYDVIEPDLKVRENYSGQVNKQFTDISDVIENDYDLIVMNQIMEHLVDPIEFIKSVCGLLKDEGIIFIDVPFGDYIFKKSVVPHVLFWDIKSLSFLLKKSGLKLIFCDTVGMEHEKAKKYFKHKQVLEKIINPWLYANKINLVMNKIGFPKPFKIIKQFNAEKYGGDRMWLRCIAKKTI